MDNKMEIPYTSKQKGRWPVTGPSKKKMGSTLFGWWRTERKITNSHTFRITVRNAFGC